MEGWTLKRVSLRSVFISSLLFSVSAWSDGAETARLSLTWTDHAHNEDGFLIERKTGRSGTFAVIAITAANVQAYTDATVTADVTYCYRVSAFNSTGLSAHTAAVCGVPTNPSRGTGYSSLEQSRNSPIDTPDTTAPAEAAVPLTPPSPLIPQRDVQIGFFRPATGQWYLDRNGNGLWDGCQVDLCVAQGGPTFSLPLFGDWTGAGTASIGVFEAESGMWRLDRNNNGILEDCQVDLCLGPFGHPGDVPVVADWTGTGTTKIGVFDPHTGLWELDLNGNGVWDGCQADGCLGPFGQPGDQPVAGLW